MIDMIGEPPSPDDLVIIGTLFALGAMIGELAAQSVETGEYSDAASQKVLAIKSFDVAEAMLTEYKHRLGQIPPGAAS